MGRILLPIEGHVRVARISADVHYRMAVQRQIRLELPGSLFTGASQEMQPSHVIHTWRCGYIRTHLDGLSLVRGQERTERVVDCTRGDTRHVLQGLSAGIYGARKEICREIHPLM